MKWVLICNWSGNVVKAGDHRETFRNERVRVGTMYPPHKPESSGKVQLFNDELTADAGVFEGHCYYPGVIDCHFEERKAQRGD